MSAVDLYNFLLTNEDELFCGHAHEATEPSPCITTTYSPEDWNMGDECFVRVDAYL